MKKKILSLMLSMVLILSLAPNSVLTPGEVSRAAENAKTGSESLLTGRAERSGKAASEQADGGAASGSSADADEEDEFEYEIEDNFEGVEGAVITKYNGEATDPVVPDTIDGYPVTVIGFDAFSESKIKTVTLPNTLKLIDSMAFGFCKSLKSIRLPKSLQTIRYNAFSGCKSLKTIFIPASVKEIGSETFSQCEKLESITFEGNKLKSIEDRLCYGCKKLEMIILPSSVKSIGSSAFSHCSKLESVKLGKSVHTIDTDAFNSCFALKAIKIPASVKRIGVSAFQHCNGLKTVNFKGKHTQFSRFTFKSCRSLKKIVISPDMKNIPECAFLHCAALKKVVLSKNTRLIKKKAFASCESLRKIHLPDKIYGIGDDAFINSGLKSVKLPANLQYIGNSAFSRTKLKNVRLPGRVTYIGNRVFSGCNNLKSISIPASVRGVNPGAFNDCTNMRSINVSSGNQYYSSASGVLFDKDKTKLLQYPIAKSGKSYQVPGTVDTIRSHAFEYNKYLESVSVGAAKIHNNSFARMKRLKSVTIQNGVTNIAEDAFAENKKLTTVRMADTVKVISAGAFSDSRIREFHVPDSIEDFSNDALRGCNTLVSYDGKSTGKYPVIDGILYENGGKTLRDYPSHRAGSTFTVPDMVTVVKGEAFYKANNLKKLFFKNTIKKLYMNCIDSCKRLKQIVFEEGTKLSEGGYAVSDCDRLAVIVGPKQYILENMAEEADATLITL